MTGGILLHGHPDHTAWQLFNVHILNDIIFIINFNLSIYLLCYHNINLWQLMQLFHFTKFKFSKVPAWVLFGPLHLKCDYSLNICNGKLNWKLYLVYQTTLKLCPANIDFPQCALIQCSLMHVYIYCYCVFALTFILYVFTF